MAFTTCLAIYILYILMSSSHVKEEFTRDFFGWSIIYFHYYHDKFDHSQHCITFCPSFLESVTSWIYPVYYTTLVSKTCVSGWFSIFFLQKTGLHLNFIKITRVLCHPPSWIFSISFTSNKITITHKNIQGLASILEF